MFGAALLRTTNSGLGHRHALTLQRQMAKKHGVKAVPNRVLKAEGFAGC